MILNAGRKERGGAPVVKGFLPASIAVCPGEALPGSFIHLGEGLVYGEEAGGTLCQGFCEIKLMRTGGI